MAGEQESRRQESGWTERGDGRRARMAGEQVTRTAGPLRRRVVRPELLGEMLGFAAAGLCAYVSDLALFLWLRGMTGLGPLTAKALSFLVACTVAYAGNALLTYRHRNGTEQGHRQSRKLGPKRNREWEGKRKQRQEQGTSPPTTVARPRAARTPRTSATCRIPTARLRRYALFFAVNLAGAAVQLLTLAVTHYGFGLTSAYADTVSGAGVGMALATVLRFWGTRTLVFGAVPN
jgi:putative flippase GtrA